MPTAGQALIHLLFLAAVRGVAVRGPMVGKEHAYVLVRDWLEPAKPVDRDVALAELARRYLVGHAPADDRDLARWAGLPLRDARAGLAAIASELVERDDGLVHLAAAPARRRGPRRRACSAPSTRCCSAGPRARQILGPHTQLVTINGIFRPFALVDGRAVATWRLDPRQGHDRAARPGHQEGDAPRSTPTPPMWNGSWQAPERRPSTGGDEMGQPVVHFEVVGQRRREAAELLRRALRLERQRRATR